MKWKALNFSKIERHLRSKLNLIKSNIENQKPEPSLSFCFYEQESRIFLAQNWLRTGSWQTSSTLIEPIKYFPHTGSLYFCSWLQKIWFWMVYILALKFLFECPFFFNVCCCFSSKDKNWRKIQNHLTQPFFNYQLQKLQLTTAIWLCNI